ncbi:TPA: TolC family protein [Enterobacter roggenkampii]
MFFLNSTMAKIKTLCYSIHLVSFIAFLYSCTVIADELGIKPNGGEVKLNFSGADSNELIEVMSLEEAIKMGLEKSNKYLASQEKLSADNYLKSASYSNFLPALDMRIAHGLQKYESTDGQIRRSDAYMSLTQPLFDLGAMAELKKSSAKREQSLYQMIATKDDIAYQISNAFYQLIEASLVVDINNSQMNRLEKLGGIIESRASVGGAAKSDSERIKARILTSRSNWQSSVETLRQASLKFFQLTGFKPKRLIYTDKDLNYVLPPFKHVLASMHENNPDLISSKKSEDYAKEEVNSQKSKLFPKVRLELSTNNFSQEGNGWKRDDRAMLVLDMSLFSGFGDYNRINSALASQNQARYERLDLENEYRSSLEIAFGAISSAENKISTLHDQLKTQQDVVLSLEKQQEINGGKILDLFDSYQEYYNSQQELVRTKIQKALLQKQVLLISGLINQNVNN